MYLLYVTDEKGKKIAVQLPLKEWKRVQKGIKKLEMFEELMQAFKEMAQHNKGNIKTPSTKQLLGQL